jgi:hypothetical protein
MCKDEFIAKWCEDHHLPREWFLTFLDAAPYPQDLQRLDDRYSNPGWYIVVLPQRKYKIRIPVEQLRRVTATLADTATPQDWTHTTPGGNVLKVVRTQPVGPDGPHDVVDFIWDEDD